MNYPQFFLEELKKDSGIIQLNEETSRHIVQVLRMNVGEKILLLNGKGLVATAIISEAHKKHAAVTVDGIQEVPSPNKQLTIAVSLLKNTGRFEWMLEKMTEIGVTRIVPLISHRTEGKKIKPERFHAILISAMLQSQRLWLPEMTELVDVRSLVNEFSATQKFIAHCEDDGSKCLLKDKAPFTDAVVLIGPEGDFTAAEIQWAKDNGFLPVSLGNTRLRTETAGVVAAAWLCG